MAQDDTITQAPASPGKPLAIHGCEAGKQIGPVWLIRQIGKGGMGEVWLARHELLGNEVAAKVLSTAGMAQVDPAFREFIQGAKVAASLGHPGLNKVHHAGVSEGVPYLVLEFLDGPNLRELVERSGRLELAAVRAVIEAVGEAVAELHHRDLVHRDLKPSNIVLTSDGRVVVTDFGLACARPVSALRGTSGLMAGTPAYMAPEMFDGVVSARTDVYAIGMTAYELLCGKPAFDGTLSELQRKHKTVAIDVEPLRAAGVPEGVIEVVVRATSKDILFRPKTARHVLEAFRTAFDEAGTRPMSREGLARLLQIPTAPRADPTRSDAAPVVNMAETISHLAARKRDSRDSSRLRGAVPCQPIPQVAVPGADPQAAGPVAVPLPVRQLVYSQPPRYGRPGLVTAMGVMSIIIASLSLLFNLSVVFQAAGFFMLSRMALSPPMTPIAPPSVMVAGSGVTTAGIAGPTTTPATAPSTALTPTEVQQVISKVQANLGVKKLNASQISGLQTWLQNPSQQVVAPGTAWSPVNLTSMQSNGTATINLSGGVMVIDANGRVTTFPNARMTGLPRVSGGACVVSFADGVLSFALAILLLVAGIATLRHSRRSLRMHQIYGWAKIPLCIVGGIAYGWVLSDFVTGMPGAGLAGSGRMLFVMYSGFIAVLGIAYPIGLLIALRSRVVRGYYHSIVE